MQHAQRNEVLRLKGLTVKLAGVRAVPAGKSDWLIVTLTVKNDSSSPKRFGHTGAAPTLLVAGGQVREESLHAEKSDPKSVIAEGGPIAPGASKTADVAYQLPPKAARDVIKQEDGGLFTGPFGTSFTHAFVQKGGGLLSLETKPQPGEPGPE